MSWSRRTFVRTLGAGTVGALALPSIVGRGREAAAAEGRAPSLLFAVPATAIRIDSNENPHGPGAAALDAIRGALGEASRYPDAPEDMLREAVARSHRAEVKNVLLGCGSTEILRMAVQQLTGPTRPLVTAAPTFEDPARFTRTTGADVIAVPVDASLKLDLVSMAAKAAGAGLIYLCNPNNPTATVRTAAEVKELVARVGKTSPDTTILIDEAYFEYVEDPGYATAIPMALDNPRVLVARTFSKVHGLAGLRVGYVVGHESAIEPLSHHRLPSGVNQLGAAAALANLGLKEHIDEQRGLNRESKAITRRFFEGEGYQVVPSETNFMMIDIRREAKEFRAACRERNILIGRPFPPLNTHIRVSMGTSDEMRRAVDVFKQVLSMRG